MSFVCLSMYWNGFAQSLVSVRVKFLLLVADSKRGGCGSMLYMASAQGIDHL